METRAAGDSGGTETGSGMRERRAALWCWGCKAPLGAADGRDGLVATLVLATRLLLPFAAEIYTYSSYLVPWKMKM